MLMWFHKELHIADENIFWNWTPMHYWTLIDEAMAWEAQKWGNKSESEERSEVVTLDQISGW